MSSKVIDHSTLRYDLKKPCKDCPFLKTTRFHEGIYNSLPELVSAADRGLMCHTCHKTDPDSDSKEGTSYTGPLQHCAGLLVMMSKDEEMVCKPQLSAWASKKWNPDKMDKKALVWDNLVEMILAYSAWRKKLLRERRDGTRGA
jgi:hypothetical protein